MPKPKFFYPSQWTILDSNQAAEAEAELHREMSKEHILYGANTKAIAKRTGRSDYLFQIPDNVFAQIHLTWSVENAPEWPSTDLYYSMEEWKKAFEEDLNAPPIN